MRSADPDAAPDRRVPGRHLRMNAMGFVLELRKRLSFSDVDRACRAHDDALAFAEEPHALRAQVSIDHWSRGSG